MPPIRDIYEKLHNGEGLTNHEIETGIDFFGLLERDLHQIGDIFLLPANEALRVHDILAAYKKSRIHTGKW